ncbi:MAG: hypothetical protein ABI304_09730 [Rudaea sp.]
MIRRIIGALAIAAVWLVLFGWAAGTRWNTPAFPLQRMQFDARDFHVVMGAGVEDETALRIGAVGDSGNALQSIALERVPASKFSTLRYHFSGFPRTLELSLVFRRADAPKDVQVVTVPWPGDGWRSLDLRKVPGWHGEITELGFAEYATPQVAPETSAFQPFRFDRVELWSPSWRGELLALTTSWFGYSPWSLLSISALGPQRETAQATPLMPLLVIGAGLSLLLSALILRWRWRMVLRLSALTAIVLWVLLDVRWLADFHAKHALTEQLYADKPWTGRQRLIADQDTAFAAEQVGYWLTSQPGSQRILVASDSKYTLLRLIYLLLPQNVALLQQVGNDALPKGSLILLYASTQWQYDATKQAIVGGGKVYSAEPVFDSGGAFLYRLRTLSP